MRFRFRFNIRLIVIVGLMLTSTIAVLALKSVSVEAGWQEATRSAPSGLMQQVVQENLKTDFVGNSEHMKIWKILQSGQSRPLFLIDTRIANEVQHPAKNPLCGALGCQFLGYVAHSKDHYQRVLSAYLKPQLPPKIALIEPTHDIHNGLPSLKVNQLEKKQIRQRLFEFDGNSYNIIETQLLPKIYE